MNTPPTVGAIYRHRHVIQYGPHDKQPPNRFEIVAVGEDFVDSKREGVDELPTRWIPAEFADLFELIPPPEESN